MRIGYFRVSTGDQTVDSQRHALRKAAGGDFDKEFSDIGVSGGTMAADRPGFGALLEHLRGGDEVYFYALIVSAATRSMSRPRPRS